MHSQNTPFHVHHHDDEHVQDMVVADELTPPEGVGETERAGPYVVHLVVHQVVELPADLVDAGQVGGGERVLKLLLDEGLSTKQAAKLASAITGVAKNALYERALALKS